MLNSEKVRVILLEEFVKAQTRNPHYSMRAYAQKVGIAQSAISEILSGKRPITKKTAERILQGLEKDPNEILRLLDTSEQGSSEKYRSVDMDVYHAIADWHYYAILSLAETKDFEGSPKWIAQRLGISERSATEAVDRLLRLDMLERDKKTGKLQSTGEQFEAISAIASPALRKANRQNLELAQRLSKRSLSKSVILPPLRCASIPIGLMTLER